MKKRILSICLVCTMMLSLASCGKKADEAANPTAEPTIAPINVTVDKASMREISSGVTYTGEVKPASNVSVSPKVSGKVTKVNVEIGQYVNAGDVLYTIDDTDLRLSYNQALAGYNSANASYSSVTGGTAQQTENQVNQAVTNAQLNYDAAVTALQREQQMFANNSNVLLAENACTTATDNYNRMKALFDIGAISQVELDASKNQMVSAQESLKTAQINARAALDAAEKAVNTAKEALDNAIKTRDLTINVINPQSANSASAGVKSAKAALDIAQNALNNTRVTAPISGYVSSVAVEKGQNAVAGSPSVGIVNMNTVEVEINVTEAVVPTISQGMSATVSVPSAGISEITGSIIAVSPSKNEQTGLFTVKVSVPNDGGVLKGGMFADVKLVTLNKTSLSVPAEAVTTDGNDSYVYINNNGSAEKKSVEIGESDGTYTEILSGISEGASVIVSGKDFITDDNNKVAVTKAE